MRRFLDAMGEFFMLAFTLALSISLWWALFAIGNAVLGALIYLQFAGYL